jgi:16S rRNA (guanine1516-N2)-methyltransferase
MIVGAQVDAARRAAAGEVAKRLHLPLVEGEVAAAEGFDLALVETGVRLELRVLRGYPGDQALVGGHGVGCELTQIDTTSGPGRSLSQPMVKAVGIKKREAYRPRVFDATAGLGEDAWLLAALGCGVRACERNPVTHALLVDGLKRAAEARPEVAARVRVELGDGVTVLERLAGEALEDRPDVVYLDPMFPTGRKTAERKAMRVLRLISGDDLDADRLLGAALKVARRRVVVKRPLRGEALRGAEPMVMHRGKSLRFDVYGVGCSGA